MLFLLLSAEVKVIKLSLVLIKLVLLSSNSMQLDYILQEFHQFNNYYNIRSAPDCWEQEINKIWLMLKLFYKQRAVRNKSGWKSCLPEVKVKNQHIFVSDCWE
jgi:hypothetical protein